MFFHQILPSPKLGGAALVGLLIAEHLRARSQAARVWVPGDGPTLREAERLGFETRLYETSRIFDARRSRAALGLAAFYRAIRREPRGLAHIHSPAVYRAIRPALRVAGLRSVVHVHLEEPLDGLRWALRRPPELIVACCESLVEHVRSALPERLRDRQRIVSLPNPVDTSRFFPGDRLAAKRRVGAPIDRPLLLMLANLAPHKGQETAIRAVAAIKQRGGDAVCWLAGVDRGDTGYAGSLRALIEGLGLSDRVRLIGQRDDAPELLRAADLMLLPSTCEGLPLSILEAQASRVPVLAAPTSGIPEVVLDGRTGYLIPATDSEGYADRALRLLADPGLTARIADQAFAFVTRRHDRKAYCETLDDLYASLLASGPPLRARRDAISRA